MSVSSVTLVRDVNNFMATSGPVTTGTTVLSLNYGTAPLLPVYGGTGTATHTGSGLPVFQTSPTIITPTVTTKANFTDGTSVENLQVTFNTFTALDQLNFNSATGTIFQINASQNQFNTNLTANQLTTPSLNLNGGNFTVPGAITTSLSFAYKEDTFSLTMTPPSYVFSAYVLKLGNIVAMRFIINTSLSGSGVINITGLPSQYWPSVGQVIPLGETNITLTTNPLSLSIANTGNIQILYYNSGPVTYNSGAYVPACVTYLLN